MPAPAGTNHEHTNRLLQLRSTQSRSHRRSSARLCLPLPRLPAPDWKRFRGAGPVGAFADPNFPPPVFSVYEDRMHGWVSMPQGIEHMA